MSREPMPPRPVRAALFAWWSLRRGLTLGVRALVRDGEGRVLLVRHGYVAGWHLPGGGVERGETAEQALARELREETGVDLVHGGAILRGVFHNARSFAGDHVLVYAVEAWRPGPPVKTGLEIREIGWFAPDALPEAVSPGTRRRLAEWLDGAPASAQW